MKPWLLEVNLSPSLSAGEVLDLNVKGNLIADLYTLIGVVPLDQRNYEKVRFNKNYNVYAQMTHTNFGGTNYTDKNDPGCWDRGKKTRRRKKIPREEKMIVEETKAELKR